MSYESRAAEYATLITRAQIRPSRQHEVDAAVAILIAHRELYLEAAAATSVHVHVLMALAYREMSGNVACYLGNGQHLSMRTTIVPKGRGPFVGPQAFRDGCVDACHIDGLDRVAATRGWTAISACYFAEEFNGDGYRRFGIPSPYVFGATTVQMPGKYIRDHVFDRSEMDPQLGVLAIIETLAAVDPAHRLDGLPAPVGISPVAPGPDIERLQQALNGLHVEGTPLVVDGSFGRRSRYAMQQYQSTRRLPQTWSPDAATMNALRADLAARA